MKETAILLLVVVSSCFTIDVVFSADPVPPASFPPVWDTFVQINVIDNNSGKTVLRKGQRIMFDSAGGVTCRYLQKIEIPSPPVPIVGVDICNFSSFFHYGISSTLSTTPYTNCTQQTNMPAVPLTQLNYPDAFMQSAKFIGIDKVSSYICNHWAAVGVSIDGKTQQMDLWTSVDKGYPCEIVLRDIGTNIQTTWAFDGFSDFLPPQTQACSAALLMCKQPNWVCHAKRGLNRDDLGAQLGWVCDPTRINCDPINPNGAHFEPNTVEDHCDWAFNQYFQKNRLSQGYAACDFKGTAVLVPPTFSSKQMAPSHLSATSFLSTYDLVCS